MLSKLRGNANAFTLIELMIVIAIIGILAAIAIPNFISYRNKSYCTMAESDAESIASLISDYFSIPSHSSLPIQSGLIITLGAKTFNLSGINTATISGNADAIIITVTDMSSRCPTDYTNSQSDVWVSAHVVQKRM